LPEQAQEVECEAERAFIVNNVIAFCKEINPGAMPQLAKDSSMQYDFQRVPLASVSSRKKLLRGAHKQSVTKFSLLLYAYKH
jgi:hypothetical protein